MIAAADPLLDLGTALFEDLYRPLDSGRWSLRPPAPVLTRGYWSPPALVPNVRALTRDGDTWMSITPLELESQAIGVHYASGHVAIFGLGMGWVAAVTAMRDSVTQVTVVERDPDVIALHADLDLFARLPGGAGDKMRIVQGDALAWRPEAPVDLLMPDIWLYLVSDGRVDEVRQMQANVAATKIYFWGQELEIARHARAMGIDLDTAGVDQVIENFGLPLVGNDRPDYPDRIRAAADAWMQDRWLSA